MISLKNLELKNKISLKKCIIIFKIILYQSALIFLDYNLCFSFLSKSFSNTPILDDPL